MWILKIIDGSPTMSALAIAVIGFVVLSVILGPWLVRRNKRAELEAQAQYEAEKAERDPQSNAAQAGLIDAVHFANRLQTDLRGKSPSIPFRCDCGHVVPEFFVERIDKGDGALGDGQLTRCLNCLYGYPYPNDDEIEDAYATRLEAWKSSQKSTAHEPR